MFSAFLQKAAAQLSVLQTVLCVSLGITFVAIFGLVQLLKPVDKRSPPRGKVWKLPPGPRGLPVIGNLLLYSKGEAAVSAFIANYNQISKG